MTLQSNLRVCKAGHKYFKSSDCLTCPVCEMERKPESGFLSVIAAPARRALENKGIKSLEELAAFSESELLKLHGFGLGSLPKLRQELEKEGLSFRK